MQRGKPGPVSMENSLMLDYAELPCDEPPRALMVWLHGLGADGYDLEPAAEMLELPGIHHVFPHAPVRPVTLNGGMIMRAWYDIAAADLRWQEDTAGMQASVQQVGELVDALRRDSTLPVILAGFSQGAVISLATAVLGMPNLMGVAAMSGYVPEFLLPSLAGLCGVPVLMAHGEQDGVIPFALAKAGREALAGSGVEVAWHSYAMSHAICQQELQDLADWMMRLPGLGDV
jgi:phospholipase/carboxylesterase